MTEYAPMSAGITMLSGTRFRYCDPSGADHQIEDGARGVASIPRFGGQTNWWYPVAMHLVNGSYVVAPEYAYEYLLHDLHEGFMGFDPPTPVKHDVPDIQGLENRCHKVLAGHFGYSFPTPPAVKQADLEMLVAENYYIRDNMELIGFDKDAVDIDHIHALVDVGLINFGRVTPSQAESLFLQRYEELRPR